jgi:hypothetical protein
MPRGKLKVNAQPLPEADTGPFGIAAWLTQGYPCDAIRFEVAESNCHVAELAGAMDEMRCCPNSRSGLAIAFLGDSHCNWLAMLNGGCMGLCSRTRRLATLRMSDQTNNRARRIWGAARTLLEKSRRKRRCNQANLQVVPLQ